MPLYVQLCVIEFLLFCFVWRPCVILFQFCLVVDTSFPWDNNHSTSCDNLWTSTWTDSMAPTIFIHFYRFLFWLVFLVGSWTAYPIILLNCHPCHPKWWDMLRLPGFPLGGFPGSRPWIEDKKSGKSAYDDMSEKKKKSDSDTWRIRNKSRICITEGLSYLTEDHRTEVLQPSPTYGDSLT